MSKSQNALTVDEILKGHRSTGFHHSFRSKDHKVDIKNVKTYLQPGHEGPGFWFTTDKARQLVRCGAQRKIVEKLSTFEALPNEDLIYVSLSYWSGENGKDEMGFRSMKNFKQQFKRALKGQKYRGEC